MLMLTTYDFARLFGGGIDSTILGEMDRLCTLTIERSLSISPRIVESIPPPNKRAK